MREKRARAQDKTEPLFDYNLDIFGGDEPFTVDYDGVANTVLSSLSSESKDESEKAQKQAEQALSSNTAYERPQPISSSDPLNPELFIGHHRRMEREERRMQVQERQHLVVTASKVKSQKEALSRSDWKSFIDKIVKIHDMNNSYEINRKRELALEEMSTFLAKFEEHNRRHNRRDRASKTSKTSKPKSKPPSKSKPVNKSKAKPQKSGSVPPKDDDIDHDDGLFISIRPIAFGYMVPPRHFPPKEFELPRLLVTEVESYDLIESFRKKRKRKQLGPG